MRGRTLLLVSLLLGAPPGTAMAATLTQAWPSKPVLQGGTRPTGDESAPLRSIVDAGGGALDTTSTANPGPVGLQADARALLRQTALRNLDGHEQQVQDERRALVLKQHREGLSADETRRLRFIRWQLDLLEDARMGQQLDQLKDLAVAQERAAQEIADVAARLEAHGLAPRPRRRG